MITTRNCFVFIIVGFDLEVLQSGMSKCINSPIRLMKHCHHESIEGDQNNEQCNMAVPRRNWIRWGGYAME